MQSPKVTRKVLGEYNKDNKAFLNYRIDEEKKGYGTMSLMICI